MIREAAPRTWWTPRRLAGLALALALVGGCAWNPATRRVDFTLLTDGEEISLGQGVDAEVTASAGQVDDPALAAYVSGVGDALAARSERPALPWTFRVIEGAEVNAFALPGGFVYVTRGLLAHLSSEAELAAVLAHEIGHVTGRHGVTQLSRARVARRSLGVFRIFDPELRHVGAIAGGAAGLALLRHSRADEEEADRLALRYLGRGGYPPAAMHDVLGLLVLLARESGGSPPAWLSTHPDPLDRQRWVGEALAGDPRARAGEARQEALYARLEGLVVGDDPRLGVVVDHTFLRPSAGYRLDFPEGWEVAFDRQAAIAGPPDGSLAVIVGDAEGSDVAAVEASFLSNPRVRAGARWTGSLPDFPARGGFFELVGERGVLRGLVVFVDRGGAVLVYLAAAAPADFDRQRATAEAIVGGLAAMREAPRAAIVPDRLTIRRLAAPATLDELEDDAARRRRLVTLNRVGAEQVIEAGAAIKLIRPGQVAVARE